MMRWQLIQTAWPFASYLVPVGTILDADAPTWNGIPLPSPLAERIPINVLCLDQDAADAWKALYSGQLNFFQAVPGVT